jgi:hypothetical protein
VKRTSSCGDGRRAQLGRRLWAQHLRITTPSLKQVRTVALIWIGSTIIIVDGFLFLLVFISNLSNSG